jgi:glycosyltransferase involved in cell wall biosynthesis
MACGKPVIAYGRGGALDTVIDGITGVLFDRQTTQSLAEAVRRLSGVRFAPDQIRAHAELFSVARFKKELLQVIGD